MAAKKAAKPAPKTAKKSTPAKPTASQKKTASKKTAASKKPTTAKKEINTSILDKAKSLYNKGKKAVTKKIETAKEKAKRLKNSISCKAGKAKDFIKEKYNNAKAKAAKAYNSVKTKAKNAAVMVKAKMKAGLKTAKGSVASFFKPYVAYAGEKDSGKAAGGKEAAERKGLYQQMLLAMEYNQRIREYNNKVMEEYRNSPQVTEKLHLALDLAGFAFDAADPANGLLYLSEWDFKNAGISFAATIPFVGSLGTVKRIGGKVDNVSDLQKTVRLYEPSPKHNKQGGWGSIDPIPSKEVGEELLKNAYSSSKNKQLYAYFEGNIVKFQPEGAGNKWHAYKVDNTSTEVPNDVYQQMLKDGVITKVQYNKFIKNK